MWMVIHQDEATASATVLYQLPRPYRQAGYLKVPVSHNEKNY